MSTPESTERPERVSEEEHDAFAEMRKLQARVRASAPLVDRLGESHRRIGKMCSERRGPRMTVPVAWDDDDTFIGETLDEAAEEIARLRAQVAKQEAVIEAAFELRRAQIEYMKEPTKLGVGVAVFDAASNLDALLAALRPAPPATEKG